SNRNDENFPGTIFLFYAKKQLGHASKCSTEIVHELNER
ncbi:unnamed protein product, partial [marine sediment metagenome]